MKNLYKLVKGCPILQKGDSIQILGITNNSKNVKQNYLFFAIKGASTDGHRFIKKAVAKGANSIVLQDKRYLKQIPKTINIIYPDNTRKAQAVIASRFFNNPSKSLKVIGITGTNGKTTTSHLINQYLSMLGEKAGIIGTIGYKVGDTLLSAGNTTPDSITWQRLLKQMKEHGAKYVVAEMSSHGIDQYRVYATRFEAVVFTNLTQDHLDYHKSMENYFNTKKKLFHLALKENPNTVFAINVDDPYGLRLYHEFKTKADVITYGKTSYDLKLLTFSSTIDGLEINVSFKGKSYKLFSKLRGDFNVYNILAALATLAKLGFDFGKLVELTPKLTPVKGRFEVIPAKGFLVINDYAHTPDALEKLLSSLQKIKKGRIILVFGAGGDRDKSKRPLMGQVAEKFADVVILTSDNPRSEKPEDIIYQIKQGMKTSPVEIIDREEAIKEAIKIAKLDDIVVIAGKGHETYQIVGDKIFHFDDSNVAKKYLQLLGKDA